MIAHSVRHELERCFESIRTHAGTSAETILVDNASTDGTVEWTRRAHPDVQIVELPENVGVAAREHGLRAARGRYTMFLDSDAALTPNAVPTMIDALNAHPDWGLLGPRLVHDDGTLQPSCRRFPPLSLPLLRRPPLGRFFETGATVREYLMHDFAHDRPRPVLYVLGACQLFRTSLARVIGPFDARIFLGPDDADWCIRIRDAGGEIVYFPAATVVHSYRRLTNARPLSRAALRHLGAHLYFHWKYRRRRGDLVRLAAALDREAAAW